MKWASGNRAEQAHAGLSARPSALGWDYPGIMIPQLAEKMGIEHNYLYRADRPDRASTGRQGWARLAREEPAAVLPAS